MPLVLLDQIVHQPVRTEPVERQTSKQVEVSAADSLKTDLEYVAPTGPNVIAQGNALGDATITIFEP